jgi:hypothetical protein
MIGNVAFKCYETFSVISTTSDPALLFSPVSEFIVDDYNITVITSNVSNGSTTSLELAFSLFAPKQQSKCAYNTMTIAANKAIADLGATQIFVMDGTPVHNKQKTTCPLKVSLADRHRVMSTHMCDIIIPGLPTTLVGHIVPELSIASLFGIRVLTEAGCLVKFDIKKCVVTYNGKIILIGMKDPTTDLWTLPIVGPEQGEQDAFVNLREEFMEGTNKARSCTTSSLVVPVCANAQAYEAGGKAMEMLNPSPPNELDLFSHTV